MRLSELIGRPVVDVDGNPAGRVHDVRVAVPEDGDRWHVAGIVFGTRRLSAAAHAWGFADGRARAPSPLRRILRPAAQDARFAASEDVAAWGPAEVRLAIRRDQAVHPSEGGSG